MARPKKTYKTKNLRRRVPDELYDSINDYITTILEIFILKKNS